MRKLSLFIALCFVFSLTAQTTDASGKKQGYWKKKDEKTGNLIYEGAFKDNKPVGVFKHYYPNDTAVRAVTVYKDGGKMAYTKLYHQTTGKLMAQGKYLNELKDSIWSFFDESGFLISKDYYKIGKKEGNSFVYLPDGKIAEEKIFKNDVLNGPFKQYFDGKLVKGEGKYANGKLDGKISYYYPNGNIAATGVYKNGSKEGVWIYKENNGKIKEKELWKNGTLASAKETEDYFKKNKVNDTAPVEKNKSPKSNSPKK